MRHKVKKMRERDEAFCHTFCLNIFPIKLAIIKKKKSYHMSIIKTCLLVKGKAKYFFHQRKRSDACKRQLLCFIRRRFFFTVLHTWTWPREWDEIVDNRNKPCRLQLQTCDRASLSRKFPYSHTTLFFPGSQCFPKYFQFA